MKKTSFLGSLRTFVAIIVIMVNTPIQNIRPALTRGAALSTLAAALISCATASAATGRTASIALSPAQLGVGDSAKYTLTLSKVNSSASTTVNYSMSGTAVRGQDYTLSGTYGRAVVAKNARTATVTLYGPSVG